MGLCILEYQAMASSFTISITSAHFPADTEIVRSLFTEYMTSLGVDLSFQEADTELANLPGKYASPTGTILIARDPMGYPIGCCALRRLAESGTCEMKRLHVRPKARGQDVGRRLATEVISYARRAGYKRMLLDTLASMHVAQKLYASLGFRFTEPYYENPLPGTLYLHLDL